ncbi:sensor histidine kinase [Aliikangiella maris]|uniref:HAMP domain-containing sensor histidine kinase n=2 Tax=Aliikangiella maris TaxID=3162458 RepID=A0ABV2BYT5_9GAMM
MFGAIFTSQANRTHSVQLFLIIVMVVSIALPAILSGAFLIHHQYQSRVNNEQAKRANNYIELLQAGMKLPLWELNMELAEPLIGAISLDPSVGKITVWDIQNQFLQYTNESYQADSTDLVFLKPITFNETVIGKVELIYSLQKARDESLVESKLLASIILIQLIFSFLILHYFINKRVTKPLTLLENAAKKMAHGDLTTPIPQWQNDEFGSLATQLELMREALDEVVNSLTEKVSERTNVYNRTNNELLKVVDCLKETQQSLIQYEKLAALGGLVAGVSHELNTPLGNGLIVATTLQKQTEQLIEILPQGITKEELDQYLADFHDGIKLVYISIKRAAELVKSFKQVAVDRTSEKRREFDLREVINETIMTLLPSFKRTKIKISENIAENIQLNSYPGPLSQVLTNLIENARVHAFNIRDIKTQPKITLTARLEDDWVIIKVTDNGCGIAKSEINRVFEPFYTTTFGKSGTGLGLQIVHNIITGILGGNIELQSEPGQGSTFKIRIPLCSPEEKNLHSIIYTPMELTNEC